VIGKSRSPEWSGDDPFTDWKYNGRKYHEETFTYWMSVFFSTRAIVFTIECMKQTKTDAKFDRLRNIRIGMMGFCANIASYTTKIMLAKDPKTSKQITFGEPQGLIIPPKFKPRRNIKLMPRTKRIPSQSTAFMPRRMLVLGLCTCKQRQIIRNDKPEIGRLIHQFHLQETYCVSAPPRRGPMPPARLHTTPMSPR